MTDEPVLDLADIQGHITTGFNSDHQTLIFLRFGDDIVKTKRLISTLSERVTRGVVSHLFRTARRFLVRQLAADPSIDMVSVAASFTFSGLSKIAPGIAAFPPGAFTVGAAGRSSVLNDPADPNDRGAVANWLYGNITNPVDALVLVAANNLDAINGELQKIFSEIPTAGAVMQASGAQVVAAELGADLPGLLAGHEHFGFKDGISQPGLRGRVDAKPDHYLTPRVIDKSAGKIATIDALPGQELLWPGEILIGYARQDDRDPLNSLPALEPAIPWMKNGSFLVYRRLRQDVERFRTFVHELASVLGADDPTAGAKLVGRWASGAPILRTPLHDDGVLASDPLTNNAFLYLSSFPQVVAGAGTMNETIPSVGPDAVGLVCPHFAHVRKVNPRDVSTESGNARSHRIMRRGIPYGAPFQAPDNVDRGLLFLAYQASIEEGFEAIQVNWANRSDQPQSGGHDILIGQPDDQAPRTIDVTKGDGSMVTLTLPDRVVRPTAATYLFAPSPSALATFAAAK